MNEIISRIPKQLLKYKELSAAHLLVYGYLYNNRNENNICYLTNQDLADEFSYGLRNMIRIMNTLKELNLISRDESKRRMILVNVEVLSE